ncbi:hypothetical protein [Rufibacter latericius]|nr:hypothetical protein [Rufibacter latericius]
MEDQLSLDEQAMWAAEFQLIRNDSMLALHQVMLTKNSMTC